MIQQTLKELGFGEKETEVYLELLRRGRATPAAIARATGITRPTVYNISKDLMKKGVVAEDLGGASLYLIALPPKSLYTLIEKQKRDMDKNETLIKQAVNEISDLPMNTQFAVPRIRFIEELNLKEFLYRNVDAWNKSAHKSDSVFWGFQDHTFVDQYKEWILHWYTLESSKMLKVRLLTNQSEAEKRMERLTPTQRTQREIRFCKKNLQFTATTWIAGDYLIMIYTRERPFYLIEIHNPMFAHNTREVFKNLWEDIDNLDNG